MTARSLFAALALCLAPAAASAAEDGAFAKGSIAQNWNLLGQENAMFTGRVVDILCELSGDCPAHCGEGARQLGIVRGADGVLVLVSKNGQPLFNGAVPDLLPYCGKQVEVDGLLTGLPDYTPAKVYQIQYIREVGAENFSKANLWTGDWERRFPEAAKKPGPWFRKDPRVLSRIEASGYLGLGKEADEAFIKENFE